MAPELAGFPPTGGLAEPPFFASLPSKADANTAFPFASPDFSTADAETTFKQTPASGSAQDSPIELDPTAFGTGEAANGLPTKKRKLAPTDEGSSSDTPNAGRASLERSQAHNTVERRYRNRLKDMIDTLRDHVPSLQQMGNDDGDRGASGQSVTKGLVLSKATQYILELEASNKKLVSENGTLKKQIMVLGKLNGQLTAQSAERGRPRGGGAVNKLMVGGLAGMLAMQGFNTAEQPNDTPPGRGLFALPINLLTPLRSFLNNQHVTLLTNSTHFDGAVSLLKAVLVVSAVVHIFLPLVFGILAPKPPASKTAQTTQSRPSDQQSGFANIQEVRKAAFLTATQALWVPERGVALYLAILLRAINLALLSCGVTTESSGQDGSRAWEIVVDGQLTGCDGNANFPRLLLTFLAAASLPLTPYRLMVRALHARVLANMATHWAARPFAGLLLRSSRSSWKSARDLRKNPPRKLANSQNSQRLSPHLADLLSLDIEEVFTEGVMDRVSKLIDRDTTSAPAPTPGSEKWVDTITLDNAIVLPLDLLSAWCSAATLQDALAVAPATESWEDLQPDLDLAFNLAPRGSALWARALICRVLLVPEKDQKSSISVAFRALLASSPQTFVSADMSPDSDPLGSDGPSPAAPIPKDLGLALRCAIAIDRLHSPEEARAIAVLMKDVNRLPENDDSSVGILEIVAMYRFLSTLSGDRELAGKHRAVCEKVGGLLRVSVRGKGATGNAGLDEEAEKNVVGLSVEMLEWLVGIQGTGGGG